MLYIMESQYIKGERLNWLNVGVGKIRSLRRVVIRYVYLELDRESDNAVRVHWTMSEFVPMLAYRPLHAFRFWGSPILPANKDCGRQLLYRVIYNRVNRSVAFRRWVPEHPVLLWVLF